MRLRPTPSLVSSPNKDFNAEDTEVPESAAAPEVRWLKAKTRYVHIGTGALWKTQAFSVTSVLKSFPQLVHGT